MSTHHHSERQRREDSGVRYPANCKDCYCLGNDVPHCPVVHACKNPTPHRQTEGTQMSETTPYRDDADSRAAGLEQELEDVRDERDDLRIKLGRRAWRPWIGGAVMLLSVAVILYIGMSFAVHFYDGAGVLIMRPPVLAFVVGLVTLVVGVAIMLTGKSRE